MDENNKTSTPPVGELGKSIFEEFHESNELKKEIQEHENQEQKDIYYFIGIGNFVFTILNITFFLLLVFSFFYIFVQSNATGKVYNYLNPVCFILRSDSEAPCQSITSLASQKKADIDTLTATQGKTIEGVLEDVYSMESIAYSKKAQFVLERSQQRMKPLDILSNFDALKSQFSSNASEVQCTNIQIENFSTLSITCDVFSSDWDKSITYLVNGRNTESISGGTSVSKANSFIHFLENHPLSSFKVIEKPSILESSPVTDDPPYTQKTTLDIKLEYINITPLAF